MKKLFPALFFITTIALHGQSFSKAEIDHIQQDIDSICNSSAYPGVVFSIVLPEGKPLSFPGGWADKESSVRMSSSHLLHGGSTGKTVVSAITMMLIEEGKLNLDDKLSDLFENASWIEKLPNADVLTLRHLLQHTSGIPRYVFKPDFTSALIEDPKRIWRPEELLEFVAGDKPEFTAGSNFSYADTNYILIGMIIEKITGEAFYSYAQKKLLDPLGLKSFSPTSSSQIPMMSQGYFDADADLALGFKSPFLINGVAQNNTQFEWTGGGYSYETREYAQLLKLICEGKVFDTEKTEFFKTVNSAQIGGEYGLGIHKLSFPEMGDFYGHGGFFPGYYSIGMYHPKSKMSFAMQINSTEMAHIRKFFPDYLTMLRRILAIND
ncbi:MAG: serine hydrolase domain-containing protein [Cyclobacteriaceae bacterium]